MSYYNLLFKSQRKYIDPSGQTAIGGNSWNNYQNDFSVPGNPFIGGSYINQQQFLTDNDIGCFHYLHIYAFGETGWIYGDKNLHFFGSNKFETIMSDIVSYAEKCFTVKGKPNGATASIAEIASAKERVKLYKEQQRINGNINDEILLKLYYDIYGIKVGDYNISLITTVPGDKYGLSSKGTYIELETGCYVGGYESQYPNGDIEIHISPSVLNEASENIYSFMSIAGHELIHAINDFYVPLKERSNPFQKVIHNYYTEVVAYQYSSCIYKGDYGNFARYYYSGPAPSIYYRLPEVLKCFK